MPRYKARFTGMMCIAALVMLAVAGSAQGVISKAIPLREVLAGEQFFFRAKVERLNPEKRTLVLAASQSLKGEVPFSRLPIKLTGDDEGRRQNDPAKMLKRLAVDLPLVIFVRKTGARYVAFCYSNGTWFQMVGRAGADPAAVRWEFTHCNPYLRRTFKGSTQELVQVVRDGLAGKKPPPEPDPNEPPGLGPEVRENAKEGPRSTTRPASQAAQGAGGPMLAVIPTFVLVGPLALLGALFPAVFGGLALAVRRWTPFLTIASIDSTLYLVRAVLAPRHPSAWWLGPVEMWAAMGVVTLLGALWLARRRWLSRDAAVRTADRLPSRREQVLLWVAGLTALALVLYRLRLGSLLRAPGEELLLLFITTIAGACYATGIRFAAARQNSHRRFPSPDVVMLAALALACGALAAANVQWEPLQRGRGVRVAWTFHPDGSGAILSSPVVSGGRIYVAALRGSGFSTEGVIYCVDQLTGKRIWEFDDDGNLIQIFSTPCLAEGRLYFGEGLHENHGCRFYCLDAASGRKLWQFRAASHLESSPCVASGLVFTGAGDDGLYCLDAVTGSPRWHFAERVHIDANPVVENGRLYVGTGASRTWKTTELLCLDATSGKVVWRVPTDLPAWGSPAIVGKQVFFGLGNGKMDRSAEPPQKRAGAIMCVDAGSGRLAWRFDTADAVLTRPALDASHVYVGARDGRCYCIERTNGRMAWKRDLGSPIVAAPRIVGNDLYAVASGGRAYGLKADHGEIAWVFDVAANAHATPQLFSTPAVETDSASGARRIYFGAALEGALGSTAALYCLQVE